MTARPRGFLPLLIVFMVTVTLGAQRGGRGGGGREGVDGTEPTAASAAYDSAEYGFSFAVPVGLQLFTPDRAGRFGQIFTNQRIIYLVNPRHREETVAVKYSDNMSAADLEGYKTVIETSPPQAKLPGFKKTSIKMIKIGKQGTKEALSYIYDVRQNDVPTTVRQVVFLHNGRGFTFTCTASETQFAGTDKMLFEPLFSHMEFK
jgi:hypothetical protein